MQCTSTSLNQPSNHMCISYRSWTMCVWCMIPQNPLRNIQEEAHTHTQRLKLHEIMYGNSLFIFE